MSQENVETVRASFEAWNAGDMDAFREMHHPGAILRMAEGWPEPGRTSVATRSCASTSSCAIDVGDRVVVRFLWRGSGHGPESNIDFTVVYTVRKGSILVAEYFPDRAEALEAVGLSE